MPKLKSHSGAKKRFNKLPSGKVKYARAFRRHLLTKKNRKRKRDLRQDGYIGASDIKNILQLLPY